MFFAGVSKVARMDLLHLGAAGRGHGGGTSSHRAAYWRLRIPRGNYPGCACCCFFNNKLAILINLLYITMNYDNPAARLLSILEKAKEIPPTTNCRTAWQKLLGPIKSNAMLISRLGKIMALPEQIIQAMQDEFPSQGDTWSHWESQVNRGFSVQNLDGSWDSFLNNIDGHSITYLRLASDLLNSKSNTKVIADDQIIAVRESIQIIYDEVLNSELLPGEVKKYVIRCLRKILVGIDEYHLTGAIPLLDAIETMVGHSAIDKDYHRFLTDSDLGKRILETLGSMANVVTVAVGIPQLSHAIVLLAA